MSVIAVVLAGGMGSRMGAEVPKQLITVAGRPLLAHTLAAFEEHPEIDEVLLMMAADFLDEGRTIAGDFPKVSGVLPGAESRHATTRAALDHLLAEGVDDEAVVLLHDAARPMVSAAVISGCVAALAAYDAVTVAIESADTIVEVESLDGETLQARTPDRSGLRRLQTPQGFRLRVIREAHARAAADADFEGTDDATVVRRYLPELPVAIVPGDERNLKVTTPLDLVLAEHLLGERPADRGL